MTELDRRLSDQLVRLVQIVFGVVIAQGLVVNKDLILDPLHHPVASLALVAVYVTTVLSWVDWHTTMELRPYNLNPSNAHIATERFRVYVDLFIVIAYAYLIFLVSVHQADNETNWIGQFVLGFVVIFAAYLASGLARRIAHGKLATNPVPILCAGSAYLLLYAVYAFANLKLPSSDDLLLNVATLVATVAMMFGYRSVRTRIILKRQQDKKAGLTIAIDIDGVLANQITGLLPRIQGRLGITLTYDKVTQWRLPLGNDWDIAKEIDLALDDDDYILSMPVHSGARELVDAVYLTNTIMLLTARPARTRPATLLWLANNGFTYDKLVNAAEEKKSLHRSDVLVDDYIGNVREYLAQPHGIAILVRQPWNQDAERELAPWVNSPRLYIVPDLKEAQNTLERLVLAFRNSRGQTLDQALVAPVKA